MDDVDMTTERQAAADEAAEAAIRRKAAAMPKGEPGDCDECGEPSQRLVEGICATCRDRIERARQRNGRRQ